MAEIKSTLDIIMEKAKKFSVTEEEKQGFKRQELEGKIKGLVQKVVDGVLASERFQLEVAALQAKDKDLVDQVFKEEVVARLEVGGKNATLLKLLEHIAGSASAAVRQVMGEFEKKAENQKESRRKALVEELKKKGISGSSVLPNLDADPQWVQTKSGMRRQLQEELRRHLKSI